MNPGPNEAEINSVQLDFYCSRSENCQREPIKYPLYQWRVLTAGQSVSEGFRINPVEQTLYHEDHDGLCNWVFTLEVKCTDILRLYRHVYRFDESLGIHHYVEPDFGNPDRIISILRTMKHMIVGFRNRLRAWDQSWED
jgi:hypothetical protein